MMLHQSMKWSLILAVAAGLVSCSMYEQNNDRAPSPMAFEQPQSVKQNKVVKVTKASSSSSEPAQRTAPGPRRAAAPQLPVIQ